MRCSTKTKLFALLMCILSLLSIIFSGDVLALKQNVSVYIEGNKAEFPGGEAVVKDGKILVPVRQTCELLGADVKWTEETESVTAKCDGDTVTFWVSGENMKYNDDDVHLDIVPQFIGDNLMVPLRALGQAFRRTVKWDSVSNIAYVGYHEKVNPMEDTVLNDKFRYTDYDGNFNGFDIFNNGSERFCMELTDISDESCDRYSSIIINNFANAVPDAKTYSMVVPTASEFYAGGDKKTDYLSKISKIYSGLSDNVRAVNVEKPMMDHAGENIFFKTDHHWTQLGAYYAYKAFLNYGFETIDDVSTFRKQTLEKFQGSFLEYTKDTDGKKLLENTYDSLDMYYPKSECEGSSYYDVNLKEYIEPMKVINPEFKSYDCFMDGDYPIDKFKTNVKNGKKICIVKESYGNAFAVWALNNYEEVYVVDFRRFNLYNGDSEYYREFKISDFYNNTKFDDLVIINYPVAIANNPELNALEAMAK